MRAYPESGEQVDSPFGHITERGILWRDI